MSTPESLDAAVSAFVERVHGLQPPTRVALGIAEARNARWIRQQEWANLPGIYAYVSAGKVRYIGRALEHTGLGARVGDHVKDRYRGDPRWDAVLDDPDAGAVAYAFGRDDGYWVAALELYLCRELVGDHLVSRRRG